MTIAVLTAAHLHPPLEHEVSVCLSCIHHETWHVLGGHNWVVGDLVTANQGSNVAEVSAVHGDRRVLVTVYPVATADHPPRHP